MGHRLPRRRSATALAAGALAAAAVVVAAARGLAVAAARSAVTGRGRPRLPLIAAVVVAALLASFAVALTVSPARAAAKVPAGFQEQVVYGGLDQPTNIAFSPDGRVFVSEKTGKIVYFNSLSDTTPKLYADLSKEVDDYWDRGLLGLALNPNFPTDPRIYVLYSYDAPIGGTAPVWNDNCPTPPGPNTDGCVISGRLSYLTPDASSPTGVHETVLINAWCQQFPSHSIGTVTFGSDGALYVGGGDGASYDQADIGQFGGSLASTPTPKNACGDPPGGVGDPNNLMQPPNAEGGALRAQSLLRQPGEPALLSGTIIRVNPDTGAAMPDNPLVKAGNADPNAQRIVADGMRNPFRFTVRPGTNELWIGDVGWNTYDAIDWVPSPAGGSPATPGGVPDYGWPCYEGPNHTATYKDMGLSICKTLYSKEGTAGARVAPYFYYTHKVPVTPGESCGTGSSSPTGVAFNPGGAYPAAYGGALFFADYSRECIWSMPLGANGQPDPAKVTPFAQGAGGVIALVFGPGGNLYSVDLLNGQIKRYVYYNGNNPPVAAVKASPTSGNAPLKVSFDASGSSDADQGDTLTYAWDFGDGSPAATGVTAVHAYTKDGQYTAQVKVTDSKGASDIATVPIDVGATGPVPHIIAPVSSATYKVGDVINYAGSATDPADGSLAASALSWDLIIHHCPSGYGCHIHDQTFTATGLNGSFVAPDHAYPSYLELKLTATDSKGYTGSTSVFLQPKTVDLTYASTPAGLQLATAGQGTAAPYTVRVIQNSQVTVDAASPQTFNGHAYAFSGWSDHGAAFHTFNAPLTPATYTASYHEVPGNTGLVAAYSLKEGSGTTANDLSGNHNTGVIHNGTWSGGNVAFNGTSTVITVPDSPSLRLTTGMTLEGWVRATTLPSSGWRAVAGKVLSAHGLSYALHESDGSVPDTVLQTGGARVQLNGTAGVPRRQWVFLSATYSGRRVRLYVNGQQVAVGKAGGALSENGGALQIGGNSALGQYFAGSIDEVRVYSRPLAQDEIQADMWSPAEAVYATSAARSSQASPTARTTIRSMPNGSGVAASPGSRAQPPAQPAAPGGLVASYGFDQPSGATAADSSGMGNNGTIQGATPVAGGKYGGALAFDGTSSVVTVPDSPSLRLGPAMTLEAWVRPSAADGWRAVLAKQLTGGLSYALAGGQAAAAELRIGQATAAATARAPLPQDVWSFLAASYDGHDVRLYVNGGLAATYALPAASGSGDSDAPVPQLAEDAGPLRIGGDGVTGQYFAGLIDQVRVYDHALTAAQVLADMTRPVR